MNKMIPTPIADWLIDILRIQVDYEKSSWIKRWWMRRRGYKPFTVLEQKYYKNLREDQNV